MRMRRVTAARVGSRGCRGAWPPWQSGSRDRTRPPRTPLRPVRSRSRSSAPSVSRAEQVRDLGDDAGARRRVGGRGGDLDPAPPEARAALETGPAEEPRRAPRAPHDIRSAVRAVVARPVLDADDRRLGPRMPQAPPLLLAPEHGTAALDPPVEGVGAEERQVAAAVAVLLDEVAFVERHVLVMAGEDEKVVAAEEGRRVANAVEVVVAEEVRVVARGAEPAQERQVIPVEERRHAIAHERPVEARALAAPAGVPRVAGAVAVGIAEVVRLPRARGKDDGDPRPGTRGRPHDQRRLDDRAPVVEPRGVDAGPPGSHADTQYGTGDGTGAPHRDAGRGVD